MLLHIAQSYHELMTETAVRFVDVKNITRWAAQQGVENIMLGMIAERRQQVEQQLLDIQQMQLELDTAEERCLTALKATVDKDAG